MAAASYVSEGASRERGRKRSHISTTSTTSTVFDPFKSIMTIGPAAGRHESGISLRQNALDLGFHAVRADPAHPESDADDSGVT